MSDSDTNEHENNEPKELVGWYVLHWRINRSTSTNAYVEHKKEADYKPKQVGKDEFVSVEWAKNEHFAQHQVVRNLSNSIESDYNKWTISWLSYTYYAGDVKDESGGYVWPSHISEKTMVERFPVLQDERLIPGRHFVISDSDRSHRASSHYGTSDPVYDMLQSDLNPHSDDDLSHRRKLMLQFLKTIIKLGDVFGFKCGVQNLMNANMWKGEEDWKPFLPYIWAMVFQNSLWALCGGFVERSELDEILHLSKLANELDKDAKLEEKVETNKSETKLSLNEFVILLPKKYAPYFANSPELSGHFITGFCPKYILLTPEGQSFFNIKSLT